MSGPEGDPPVITWDDLVGKYLLIGLTYTDGDDRILEQRQLHGRVIEASGKRGIVVELLGWNAGERFELPPDLRCFQPAKPGQYRLRSTGEIVEDPDYVVTWFVTRPEDR
jgi:hypothetical protein